MENPYEHLAIEEFGKVLQNEGAAVAAAQIQDYLDKQDEIPLNIGITGESGSGKSSFVNAFRGIDQRDERAAPTDCVETTSEVTPYPHPHYPNVTLWDLPGIGTTKFPAAKYLEHVEFEKFDFFIIISAGRFRENDVKLAKEIQRMGKRFYFVRSKVDTDLYSVEQSQRDFNAESTLKKIRDNCIKGLQEQGFESAQVFLVSSFKLHLYDFHQLQETLEKELPAHKRNVLLYALPIKNRAIIERKKEALKSEIKYIALLSALVAGVPIPGLSVVVDIASLLHATKKYQVTFGLDNESLKSLAHTAHMDLDELKSVMTSHLAAVEITKEVVMNTLYLSSSTITLMEAEEMSRFIPIIGIPTAMGLSAITTYNALNVLLNLLADDAHKVFVKALGLSTTV
ncbi:interferon-inducible GTPase 5-like [Echeneis naucrates]|uniref:Interferon-inducible GTPase 5-like n=1 Tax=Echeneis naucrates TaxID=173247 RepID=A0A665UZJ5_ECHNA|nr:interferon-inducible GTPase 5-like [Echeneis naucrates]